MFSTSLLFCGKRLTLKEVSGKSPFTVATVGKVIWIPGQDAYSFLHSKNGIKSIQQVDFLNGDTTLFLDGKKIIFDNRLLRIADYTFSADGKRLLLQTDREKNWRRSHFGTY